MKILLSLLFSFSLLLSCGVSQAEAAGKRISGSMPVASSVEDKALENAVAEKPNVVKEKEAPVVKVSVPVAEPIVKKTVKKTGPLNYVGDIETYKAKADDTLLTIGEREGLGYVELRSANPAMDPWHPGSGTFVILPKMHLLPDSPRRGIVVNLSEMRLYYYNPKGKIQSYPIGVGREGFSTPMGTTSVTRKTIGPVWRPTPRMLREDPTLKSVVNAGPENPLGTHALYLGWPQYLLHGTNKPWGIGRRVSSGCVRMYNNSAEELYNTVPVGTPVAVVRQPIKFGWVDDMLYIEAHPDGALADQVERVGGAPLDYKVPTDIFENLSKAAGKSRDLIDWTAVREALRDRRGYPVPILKNVEDAQFFVTKSMMERAGTSRFGPRLTEEVQRPLTPGMTTLTNTTTPAADVTDKPRRRSSGFNG